MKNNITWLVLKTSVTGFEEHDYEITSLAASFKTEEEAENFVKNFKNGGYDVRIFIVKGREFNN